MFLADIDIKKALQVGDLYIKDFEEARLQPASYDILLGNQFIVTDPHATPFVDPAKGILPKTKEIFIPDGGEFMLHPSVSVLGSSHDFFGASNKYLIHLSGKSSLARIGLMVHNTAGIVNPGHYLNITLELCNLSSVPIILRPKMKIAQLLFSMLTSPTQQEYSKTGSYSDKNHGTVAGIFKQVQAPHIPYGTDQQAS
ncbi:MAG: dCTP deaminase [Candidatus Wildermuthbacteria bacterium RIFCSPHIGHO2_12_FULL_45_9]|uniref:dCTP deaminase n=1 Tax=Candidatus Wildermuthbacteria bacterium RIFCSPHIGHO2_02_FULL_45_25 TaxID=1802450 RepID=A0A1G2QXA8_9BACT|nr:MAG: dCTP deaminase [Candidatus Wildermuthbacteria bacterium RIFCSPHIGHO2_01_FULL_45_20]OHA65255.1 MAG: dCTP deaminase [Candidatus Wildermuthbacteria bacterium RIFCSPHIGHO2_02_FULL_45_25]OHA71444.1 MAG: dCTP deaminase [Candidatus Wildermuthbacteria bacterium RIFCSPHIGHO2_12_FULL_45_9]